MVMNVRKERQQNLTPLQSLLSTTTSSSRSIRRRKKDTNGNGNGHHLEPPVPSQHPDNPTKEKMFPCNADDECGCMDVVAAVVAAVSTTYSFHANIVNHKSDDNQRCKTSSRDTAVLPLVTPPLLQRSKGVGMVECRESVRDLLRFFGHAPLLHLEGVIWVKMSGERVHCIAALSNSSIFLVPLRDPTFVRGIVHGFHKAKQNVSSSIVEVPFSSIQDVYMVSARENINIFAKFEANWVSRPFRVVTAASHRERLAAISKSGKTVAADDKVLTFVGFDAISRLRHLLLVARESWAVRTAAAIDGGPIACMATCTVAAAQRYLAEAHQAMTGPLRNQIDAQVELMEGLADEMVLDAVVKEAFFSTGDIFFEIAQYIVHVQTAAADAEKVALRDELVGGGRNKTKSGEENINAGWPAPADVRRFAAATAVLDSAFFHSLQVPGRIDFVSRPMPVSLPVVAGLLVEVYSSLYRRLSRCRHDHNGDPTRENTGGKIRQGLDISFVEAHRHSGKAAAGRDEAGRETKIYGAVDAWAEMSTHIQDRVVRAINGMSDAISLFNIEHEHLGLVRNLVGVGLGRAWRAGVQPAASEALTFLVMVNDRAIGLIEDLDCREQTRRRRLRHQQEEQEKEARKRQAVTRFQGQPSTSPAAAKTRPTRTFFSPKNARRDAARSPHDEKPSPGSRIEESLSPSQIATPGAVALAARDRTAEHSSQVPSPDPTDTLPLHRSSPREAGLRTEATAALRDTFEGVKGGGGLTGGRERGRSGGNGVPVPKPSGPRDFLSSAPVLLYSYAKLLNALVCGSYNLRVAFMSSCEADLRNIGRVGGYLNVLEGLDGGAPRMVFREVARLLLEILVECDL